MSDSSIVDQSFLTLVQSVTETLESIARDRSVLKQLPADTRERFERAVASIQDTDPVTRRLMLKAAERERRSRVDTTLHETGIRALRRKPVLTSPNVFPPWSPDQSRHPGTRKITPRSPSTATSASNIFR